MKNPPLITVVFGTRPEAIKLAPVIEALTKSDDIQVRIAATAQHRDLLDQMLGVFGLEPDVDLDLMKPGQTLDEITARVIEGTGKVFDEMRPALILVQGDTTTVFASSLAAYYRRIPVGHVEAGLRSGHPYAPFPEELNRRLASALTTLHFAPTDSAAENLRREGVAEESIHVTGNPVIDAVGAILERSRAPEFPFLQPDKKLILMTAHRRESFGVPFVNICEAVKEIAEAREDVQFVYPVHPNPHVREVVGRVLGQVQTEISNITLLQPLDYITFVHLMTRAHILLTDSGGIQEEASFLGKPVLVMRDVTERMEAVNAGGAKLVGTDRKTIVGAITELLDDQEIYNNMARKRDVFGDGKAGKRIAEISRKFVMEKNQ